jgi:hypothetical protein
MLGCRGRKPSATDCVSRGRDWLVSIIDCPDGVNSAASRGRLLAIRIRLATLAPRPCHSRRFLLVAVASTAVSAGSFGRKRMPLLTAVRAVRGHCRIAAPRIVKIDHQVRIPVIESRIAAFSRVMQSPSETVSRNNYEANIRLSGSLQSCDPLCETRLLPGSE